jgi:hypothetical protein
MLPPKVKISFRSLFSKRIFIPHQELADWCGCLSGVAGRRNRNSRRHSTPKTTRLKSLRENQEIFVGRGFSHDLSSAKSVRLYRLREKAYFVIPSEARNPSSFYIQVKEGFLGTQRASE